MNGQSNEKGICRIVILQLQAVKISQFQVTNEYANRLAAGADKSVDVATGRRQLPLVNGMDINGSTDAFNSAIDVQYNALNAFIYLLIYICM